MSDVSSIAPDEWMRDYHAEFKKNSKHIPFIYRDTLKALLSSLSGICYINSEGESTQISKVYANQERAIAVMNKGENITLPIISVSQTTSKLDNDRRRPSMRLIYSTIKRPRDNRAYRVITAAPAAVNIEYNINIWTKYLSDMDQIIEQIRVMFNPSIRVVSDDFKLDFVCFLSEEEDNSDKVVKSGEERDIKRSIGLEVEGYIPSPKFLITSTGRIQMLGLDFDINNVQ